jgi:hypothetical protein
MIDNGLFDEGYLVTIAPVLNYHVQDAAEAYQAQLREPEDGKVRFINLHAGRCRRGNPAQRPGACGSPASPLRRLLAGRRRTGTECAEPSHARASGANRRTRADGSAVTPRHSKSLEASVMSSIPTRLLFRKFSNRSRTGLRRRPSRASVFRRAIALRSTSSKLAAPRLGYVHPTELRLPSGGIVQRWNSGTLTPSILVRIHVPQPGILLKSLRICSFLRRRNSLETSAC